MPEGSAYEAIGVEYRTIDGTRTLVLQTSTGFRATSYSFRNQSNHTLDLLMRRIVAALLDKREQIDLRRPEAKIDLRQS